MSGTGREAMAEPVVPREMFAAPVLEVAPRLLGMVIEHATPEGTVAVRLTEVEAYDGPNDPGSHAYRGRTQRNAVMFGPPGHVYVYFTYGMHFCMNLVCGVDGVPCAVLLRAGEVIEGEKAAWSRRRAAKTARDLARGPARLAASLGVDRAANGLDACDPGSPLRIRRPSPVGSVVRPGSEARIQTGPRVGVAGGSDLPWRFWLDTEPTVSAYRPHTPRRRH